MFRNTMLAIVIVVSLLAGGSINMMNSQAAETTNTPEMANSTSTLLNNAVSPVDTTLTTIPATPVFSWDAVAGITQYRIFLQKLDPKKMVLDQTISCNGSTCTLDSTPFLVAWGLVDGAYRWWIGTSNNGSAWNWSQPNYFTVDVPAPAVPTNMQVDPGEGRVTLTFGDDPNTFWVQVWIGPNKNPYNQWHSKNPGSKAYSCTASTCTIRPAWDGTARDDLKIWMRSWGPGGFGGGSATKDQWVSIPLNLPSTPPNAPLNFSPSGEFNVGEVSQLSWSASDNATWYKVVIASPQRIAYTQSFLGEDIGCPSYPGTCTVSVPSLVSNLVPSSYQSYIRAWGPGGYSINGNVGDPPQWNKSPLHIYCPAPTIPANAPLRWAPPTLVNPITIVVPEVNPPGIFRLDDNKDYIIQMPSQPYRRALKISGGHNVVIIGGEIYIPWQGADPPIRERTGVTIYDVTGTIHIEGLKISGPDLSEGFQIDARNAIIQLQNILLLRIHARDEIHFDDNHPDLIQPWGGYKELRVDKFAGSSDYQGIFLKPDFGPLGPVHLSRVNIVGLPTARYLFWMTEGGFPGPVTLDNVWIDVPPERSGGLGNAVWPPVQTSFPYQAQLSTDVNGNQCVSWPAQMQRPSVQGSIYEGVSPEGYFVTTQAVGLGYVSPGYAN